MLEEASEIVGLQVYTNEAVFLGNVTNLVVDIDNCRIDGIFIADTNPELVEEGKNIIVPFRWIQAIRDVVILRYFPKKVTTSKEVSKEE
jgi:sporulation protein YlmC with PRC-barrel domain